MPHITLEPDTCVSNIEFEIGEYSPMFLTDLPDYTGETTVTPSMETQTLETANKAMHDNVVVEAIPYDEVEAATPVITVDEQGKVTATSTQAGGIVESATKTAEYQQPIVQRAKPTVSVDNAGKITAATSQAGGFVQAGTESTELQQEIVAQATPSISVASDGVITATATQTGGFVAQGTKNATLQQEPVEQATPSISVANDGTVTAQATQTAGFVNAGTMSATYSLPTQGTKTITPTESAQTAVTAGKWTTGAVQVDAIPSDYFKPSGTLPITSNGTYDVKSYANANVNVQAVEIEPLTVTENGVYTASSGHAYTPITVNVEGGKEYPAHDDNLTYFYIDIPNNVLLNVPLTLQKKSGTIDVYWGDGSHDAVNGTSLQTLHHAYQEPGEYTIIVDATNGSVVYGGGTQATTVFGNGESIGGTPSATSMLLKAVEIGAGGYTSDTISNNAFLYCENNESVVLKNGITHIGSSSFSNNIKLRKVDLPNTLTTVDNYAFINAGVKELVWPESVTSIVSPYSNMFNLLHVHIPSNATITNRIVSGCLLLEEITVPSNITNIPAYGFATNTSVLAYHFLATTPPTLANTNAFYGIRDDCVFYVPAGSLEAYKTANNWSTYASRMVGE